MERIIMSLDLTLAVINPKQNTSDFIWPDSIINLDICHKLFEQLFSKNKFGIKIKKLKRSIWWHNDNGAKQVDTDPYGTKLTFIYSEELKKVVVPKETTKWNKKFIQVAKSLPKGTKIILWWH